MQHGRHAAQTHVNCRDASNSSASSSCWLVLRDGLSSSAMLSADCLCIAADSFAVYVTSTSHARIAIAGSLPVELSPCELFANRG